jgi:hypothetical protein
MRVHERPRSWRHQREYCSDPTHVRAHTGLCAIPHGGLSRRERCRDILRLSPVVCDHYGASKKEAIKTGCVGCAMKKGPFYTFHP